MTTYYHTNWQDGVTEYNADDMNAPLETLDQAISEISGEINTYVSKFHNFVEKDIPASSDEIVIYDVAGAGYKKAQVSRLYSGSGENPYDIGVTYNGAPTDGLVLLRLPAPRTIYFASNMGPSKAVAGTGATAESTFTIRKDGVQFATCTFAGAATVGTFSGSETHFHSGEVLTLVAPASADNTLADLGFCLSGTR